MNLPEIHSWWSCRGLDSCQDLLWRVVQIWTWGDDYKVLLHGHKRTFTRPEGQVELMLSVFYDHFYNDTSDKIYVGV